MGFMHLWAILGGLAAVGVPLAVHYLTRPRPVKMPLSTLRFVRESVKQRKARHRLRDALILGTRMLALLLLALAFARPLISAGHAPKKAGAVERVVVLDVSASMGAVSNGVASMERARGVAARYLADADGLRADLLLAGARAQTVFGRPSANLGALREELGQARARAERLNLAAAIRAAGDLFGPRAGEAGQKGGPRREVVLISDVQRTNWGAADFSPLPRDVQVIIESVAPAERPENLAVLGVKVTGRPAAGQRGQMEVEVGNFGRAARTVQVQVHLDGRTYNLEKTCAAGERAHLTAEVAYSRKGWAMGEASLVGADDALGIDNRRSFVVDVRSSPAFLLVSRDPADPRATSSHFLERALAPGASDAAGETGAGTRPGRGGERVIRINAGALDQQTLSEADAVVLDRPGRLDGTAVALLAGSLRRGKSILYVANEAADAINLGALAAAAGADLRMPVEFLPPPASGASSATRGVIGTEGVRGTGGGGIRRNLSLAEVRRSDPVWSIYGDGLQQTLETLRFTARLTSRQRPEGLADDILASYTDRSACLVATPCGQGTLIVLNADLAGSNIVTSGAFVPLVAELSNRLVASRGSATVEAGEAIALALPADAGNAADLTVAPPAGMETDRGSIVEEHGALVWRLTMAPATGVYRVMRGEQLAGAVAVGVSPDEANLAALGPDVLKGRLAGGRDITVHTAAITTEGSDRAWVWLAGLAAVAMLFEFVLLRLYRT